MRPGERLRKFRESRGWNRKQLADLLRCDQTYIGQIEKGKRRLGNKIGARLEVLTAGLDGGPIRTLDWLTPADRKAAEQTRAPAEPKSNGAAA